ncbi:MAG: ChbG/HpnK family deacetylase [Paludibaculum sp.]
MRGQFHRKLARHGCRTTDWFAGFQITGRFRAEDVVHLLENLPDGSTEFMVHPGFCTAELQAARTRLKESRAAELQALVDPRVRETVRRVGIELCGYGAELGGG